MTIPHQPIPYQVRLKSRCEVAEGTIACNFDKPSEFSFQAGQFIDLIFLDQPNIDSKDNQRTFTIASAPIEDDLMVVTRIRDSTFKRQLTEIALGIVMGIDGPYGKLTLPEDISRPVVFLAGGIGITPFRSMIVQATAQNLSGKIILFYANRRPEDAPFLDELQSLQQRNPDFTFVGMMTNAAGSDFPWSGETGYVNSDMLTKYVSDIDSSLYYIVGSPAMVKGVKAILNSAGIRKSNVKTEEFMGY